MVFDYGGVRWIAVANPPYTSWRFKTAEAVLLQAHRALVYNDERGAWQRYFIIVAVVDKPRIVDARPYSYPSAVSMLNHAGCF